MSERPHKRKAWNWWYLLLIVQVPLALCIPFYDKIEPTLSGIPFFYWFQLSMVLAGAALTAIVYFATERAED
jgi:hypothetical protein